MSDPNRDLPAQAAAAPARVVCLRCGYDIRGLPAERNCPECGMAVARSLVPDDELRHAPPGWLAGLTWGAWLLLASLVGFVVSPFVEARLEQSSAYLPQVVLAGLTFLFLAAVWLLTWPQPRFGTTSDRWRWALRAIAGVLLLQAALLYGGNITGNLLMFRVSGYLGYAFIPFPLLLFLHLRRLALRVLKPSLAEHCAIIGVGASAAILVLFALEFTDASQWAYRRGGIYAIALTAIPATALTFVLWSMLSLLRFAIAFGRAWRASRDAWERADMATVDAALSARAAAPRM